MDGPEKIKWVIVEAIGNSDGTPGEWKETCYSQINGEKITFNRHIAEQIAEAIYQALKSRGYLAGPAD